MKIYFNTEVYGLELAIESDSIHTIIDGLGEVRHLMNKDSYIGLEKELDRACKISMTISGGDLYYFTPEDAEPFVLVCMKYNEGIRSTKYSEEAQAFMYNRWAIKLGLRSK